MILPTMTISEIREEISKDFWFYGKQIFLIDKDKVKYARMYIRNYPYISIREVTSPITNITYKCVIYIHNKYKQKNPQFIIYTKYSHAFGVTIIEPFIAEKCKFDLQIFTPHFLKRYRERMRYDETLSPDEIFVKFRLHNGSSNRCDKFIIDDEEKYYHNKDTDYYGDIVPEGACICEVDKSEPHIIVHNTFISRDMFFKSQDEASKMHLITVLWGDFIFNYPRQKDALERKLLEMEQEAEDVDELLKLVVDFVDNY